MEVDTTKDNDTKIKRLEAELAKNEKAKERVLLMYEDGDIDRAKYLERLAVRTEHGEELSRQRSLLQSLTNGTKEAKDVIQSIDEVVEVIATNEGAPEDISEINKALRELIDNIIYSKDGDKITLKITYL